MGKLRSPIEAWKLSKVKVRENPHIDPGVILIVAGDRLVKELERVKRFGEVAPRDCEWPRA